MPEGFVTSRRLLAASATLALVAFAATAGAATVRADVYLVQGEGLKAVPRQLSQKTVKLAIESLLHGPTATEAKTDVRTQIPAGTKLRNATVKSGVATIDFTRRFVEGTNRASLLARLVQVVWTATTVPGVTGVRVWIDGKAAKSLGQGISVDRTLTRANVDPPHAEFFPPVSVAPDTTGPGSAGSATTKWIQQRLVALDYLPASAATGHLGQWTQSAVLAFQGWEKLQRDAVPGPQTIARLKVAKRPTPAKGSGKRIEVHLTAQVAFHESPSVPAYPASHGCVRVPRDDAPAVYAFAALHTPVQVVR